MGGRAQAGDECCYWTRRGEQLEHACILLQHSLNDTYVVVVT
jgi:hypothetical protein